MRIIPSIDYESKIPMNKFSPTSIHPLEKFYQTSIAHQSVSEAESISGDEDGGTNSSSKQRTRKSVNKSRPDTAKVPRKKRKQKAAMMTEDELLNMSSKWWTSDMFKHRLLERDEEISLARLVQRLQRHENVRIRMAKEQKLDGPKDVHYQDWAKELGIDPLELQRELVILKSAKKLLVEKNVRLVASIAQQYHIPSSSGITITMSDLIQEGCMGLIRAAEKFDPDRGFKFSTYATFWVKQRIRLFLKERLIKIPVRVQDLSESIRRLNKQHLAKYQREMTNKELGEALDITEEKVVFVKDHTLPAMSLDVPMLGSTSKSDQKAVTLLDLITVTDTSANSNLAYSELRQELERSMRRELNQLERDIVRMRNGLDDGKQKSLRELGELLKMSPHMVKKKEQGALMKLRNEGLHEQLMSYTENL
eukprot:CAMPEP_0117743316 /NCGR_PEP_ID=MMETSP0947-20121206/6063_1 /TAXON_ID=44440 /ORGANISM="Chattonella subsalsa, Strain CCMP2191" /LENGTH=421 /DNA_ID=CAMNT_0005559995 /DNA_START=384 /DNA_END=1649 /DNA_ORIENTATION=-